MAPESLPAWPLTKAICLFHALPTTPWGSHPRASGSPTPAVRIISEADAEKGDQKNDHKYSLHALECVVTHAESFSAPAQTGSRARDRFR